MTRLSAPASLVPADHDPVARSDRALGPALLAPATVAAAVTVQHDRPAAGPAVMLVRDDPHASVATLLVTTAAGVAVAVPAVRAGRRIVRRAPEES